MVYKHWQNKRPYSFSQPWSWQLNDLVPFSACLPIHGCFMNPLQGLQMIEWQEAWTAPSTQTLLPVPELALLVYWDKSFDTGLFSEVRSIKED